MEAHVAEIAHAIQMAVAPVFLLTAIATLINVLNTRLSRSIDRRRQLDHLLRETHDALTLQELQAERDLHVHRLRVIYLGILSAVLSALMICLVVIGAFLAALLSIELSRMIAVLFILAMLCVVTSLGMFLREVFLMLK
ncbi:DUF2721 domain-containing protein [Hydromonas duriensis]|uniref:Uncharacterized protein DUF2721 n=1 Tax=Hydromonas duriensis TaxID=1527608 RepID=A0A4R6Y7F0_9BURK|nr:DUF2721 domain-containing protein [Hydromonas duriensis]TDR31253.1 uncharacterized protein DUF2721 [Hydromonas duriensis]